MNKNSPQRAEYIARINRVLDYIERNLDENLTLSDLAKVANFSNYHFHRIFRFITNETLNQFIQRIRLEKALSLLLQNKHVPITEIALDCGFSSSATFARCFKDYYKISASEMRKTGISKNCKTHRNIRENVSNLGKATQIIPCYDRSYSNPKWKVIMESSLNTTVEVKNIDAFTVAYVRYVGPYKGNSNLFEGLFNQIFSWAGPRGLIRMPETKVLAVYHDNPEITDEDKLRTSICLSVPEDTEVSGEIGKMKIEGGQYAVARFELAKDQYEEAWKAVYAEWLPESGYQPDDKLCFEMYQNDPKAHPEGKCIVDICIPVKPL